MPAKRFLVLSMAALVLILTGTGVKAEWQPKEPINIIVGFSPGGGTDIIARHIASVAQPNVPVPLVVINKPGASGSIAAEYVKNSKPDGYTMFVAGGSESVSIGNHQKLPYDIRKDFSGIMQISRQRVFIAVPSGSPWKTVDEMVADAKANPGKYKYASSGSGSTYHSIMLVFSRIAGFDMKHIPYKGGAPALAALIGGHVDVAPIAPSEFKVMLDAGKIQLFGVTSDTRMPMIKDVPTMKEQGYDIYIENIKGLAGPAGMDPEVVSYLHDRFKKALESDAFTRLAKKANIEVQYRNGKDYVAAMSAMFDQVGSAMK